MLSWRGRWGRRCRRGIRGEGRWLGLRGEDRGWVWERGGLGARRRSRDGLGEGDGEAREGEAWGEGSVNKGLGAQCQLLMCKLRLHRVLRLLSLLLRLQRL